MAHTSGPNAEPPALSAALGSDDINVSFPAPRPASVFQLAGATTTGSGRFVLPDVALRKVVKKPIFENFDDAAYNVKPPTQMLRFIDGLRYHKPTPEECETLNLSSATERIYLHVLNDKDWKPDTKRWMKLSGRYQRRWMRYRFPGVKKLEDDPSHFEFLSNRRRHSLWLARQYVVTFAQLKTAMQEICDRVQRDMAALGAMSAPKLADINDAGSLSQVFEDCDGLLTVCALLPLMSLVGSFCCAVEAEFEAKTHRPFPTFLRPHSEIPSRATQQNTAWTVDPMSRPSTRSGSSPSIIQRLTPAGAYDSCRATHKAEFRVDHHSMVLVVTKVVQADGQVIIAAQTASSVRRKIIDERRRPRIDARDAGFPTFRLLTTVASCDWFRVRKSF
ncbi:hypothetical protein GQ600_22048 [Phytophthora cactorum]|nr:hypothetical protein GQ600_22048 [Phytophthora cactorum]